MANDSTYPEKIATPAEIRVPAAQAIDHGMTLAHDMGGKPLHYVHEVSLPRIDVDGRFVVMGYGYREQSGWVGKDGTAYWLYTKTYPPAVAAWAMQEAN